MNATATPSQRGLTAAEVQRSREQHGGNQLTQKKRNGFFRQFLASFGDPIIKILLAALASGAALALVLIRQRCVLLRPTKGSV